MGEGHRVALGVFAGGVVPLFAFALVSSLLQPLGGTRPLIPLPISLHILAEFFPCHLEFPRIAPARLGK